jgi:hypothetical protein
MGIIIYNDKNLIVRSPEDTAESKIEEVLKKTQLDFIKAKRKG